MKVVLEGMDVEFGAMAEVIGALDKLDPRARMRVLTFVMDRLGMAEISIRVEAKSVMEAKVGGMPSGSKSFD